MNVVIYARFSSHHQTEQSIEGQLKECYDYARRNNYTVVGEYIDRAISGTTDNRPEFKRMIVDSKGHLFQGVLVYQLDRFARNRYDSATYKAKLKKNGVKVISARENISDDASGVLMEAVLEGMAEYYSKELGQKVMRGMKVSASKCLSTGSYIPLGYKIVDRKYVIDEHGAEAVKYIFNKYATGTPIVEINQYLNDNHYRTSRGGEFNKNSLRRILSNKKYIGIYEYSDVVVKDGVPRIISDELFDEVQNRLTINKKAPARAKAKEDYILTTKLFCGHCRSLMTGASGTSHTGEKHSYYVCNKAKIKQCNKKRVKKNYIEDLVIKHCRSILTDDNIEIIAKAVAEACQNDTQNTVIKHLEKMLKENEKAVENLFKALETGAIAEQITSRIQEKNKERLELEKRMAAERNKGTILTKPQVKFFLKQLQKGNDKDIKVRKALIAVFVNAIYLYDDKVTYILNAGNEQVTITEDLLDDIETSAQSSFINSLGLPKN